MKVTTDACLFGAWCAQDIKSDGKLLDIGAGTGLLMLMLAQRGFTVDGIELDEAGFSQLKKNLSDSPWSAQLQVFFGDVRTHSFPEKYAGLIVNPPFYENDLETSSVRRNRAMHSESLTLEACLDAIDRNLCSRGHFSILLPWHRVETFIQLAEATGFHPARRCHVRQTPAHGFFRGMLRFERKKLSCEEEEISIKDTAQQYTPEFIRLLHDYYLYL